MRLLDEDSDSKLGRVILYLTKAEAEELRDALNGILKNPVGNHAHVPSEDYQKEITVCIYDETLLTRFNERSIKLIKKDR